MRPPTTEKRNKNLARFVLDVTQNKEDSTCINKKARFGPVNGNWKGGRFMTSQGYWRIKKRDHHFADCQGSVMEHRDVWEREHNACLLPWADVDHINMIKTDNRPENLRAMMHGQHNILHKKMDLSGRVCSICGSGKTYTNSRNGRPNWRLWNSQVTCARCCARLEYNIKIGHYISSLSQVNNS